MASAHNSSALARLRQTYAGLTEPPGAEVRLQLAEQIAQTGADAGDCLNLAFERFSAFQFGAAHQALERSIALQPDLLPARWLQFQYPRNPVPGSLAEQGEFAASWERGLSYFERLDLEAPAVKQQLWGCLGACTAFYRHYLGDDVTALQRRYGAWLARAMQALTGPIALSLPQRPRPRLLFCSTHFYQHTVGRLFWPLIKQLPREQFDIQILHLGPERDSLTAEIGARAPLHGGPRNAPDWMHLIRSLQPDAIVYLDLGMDPLSLALAALRLAPVQASLWGHPVTSGLPSIDYALSPDLMEPADAEAHYSETLIRLPGLGHGLAAPAEHADALPAVAAGEPLRLLCAQSVYKFLPEQDALFARMLAGAPNSELHCIPHPEPGVRDWLKQRLLQACAAHQVNDASARIVMHGYGSLAEFKALASRCQLNLDTLGWSGGMSSIDLLGLGLPTVTLRGPQMRGRQTAALLDLLGAGDCVAENHDDYLRKALNLAGNPSARAQLSERMRAQRQRLFDHAALPAFLAEFLSRAIADSRRRSR